MNATATHHELWQTTYNWLRLNGIAINKKFCKEQVSSHSDYPALTSVTDLLEEGSLDYTAAQADVSYIREFNYPVLAHIKQPGNEFLHIVESQKDWENKKETTQHWSVVVLFAEKNSSWRNAENELYRKNELSNKIYTIVVFISLVALYSIAIWMNPLWYMALFGIFSLIGLFASVLIIGNELGVQNSITKQVCGAISAGGCDAVLKTNYSKGLLGFSTGDISTLYFATQFVAFLFSSYYSHLFYSAVVISLSGLFVAIWSIYTQAIIIKQWCALCLVIVATLFVQFIISSSLLLSSSTFLLTVSSMLVLLGIGTIGAIILLPIKNLLKMVYKYELASKELKKWKIDADLFIAQWEKEQFVDTTIWENDLIVGNPDAPIRITVACNPYCGPCAKTHIQLDRILERYKSAVCIQMRFLFNDLKKDDKKTMAVENILRKSLELNNEMELQSMLTDWFLHMNYEVWSVKWAPLNTFNVNTLMNLHTRWIEASRITYTPTLFINGRKLPKRYGLEDFDKLLPHLKTKINSSLIKIIDV